MWVMAPALALSPASTAPPPVVSTPAADAPAPPSTWWRRFLEDLDETWDSDQYELYVPLHTWHNRRSYTAEHIAGFNENPWGVGIGKVRYDSLGNWHSLYMMEFQDSHDEVEPLAGYGYEMTWRQGANWRLGLGYTVGVTARQDVSYVLVPFILPLASIEYGRFSLQSTYVPGGKGYGNILFTWMRWKF